MSGRPVRALLLAALLVLCALPLPARAAEAIVDFVSDIAIDPDGTLDIVETIRVRAEGEAIRRGIYRDFPTLYRDRYGNRVRVGFELLGVTRNGSPEPWHTEPIENGVRIYAGSADRFIEPGLHTYTLRYRTTGQLGFFEAHDELYWNVTGNGWAFPVEAVTARVALPGGATPMEVTAYTGPSGAQGTDYRVTARARGLAEVKATAALPPGHGLTIVVTFPKGVVTEPGEIEKASTFVRANAPVLVGALGFLSCLAYYMVVWLRAGRDPPAGTIFPRFAPPEGLSPAAVRFISRMGFDTEAFAAALTNLAVKGHLRIEEEEGGTYRLVKTGGSADGLSPGERQIAGTLLGTRSTIVLAQKNHRTIAQAVEHLKSHLKREYEGRLFRTNTRLMIPGLVLTVLTGVGMAVSGPSPVEALFLGLWLLIWLFGTSTLIGTRISAFRTHSVLALAASIFSMLVVLPFLLGAVLGLFQFARSAGPIASGLFVLTILLVPLFYVLMKAPTRAGRAVMDEIEGFRRFLEITEKERLDALHPPDMTAELFERYLPYAIALDVETRWAQRFESEVVAAGQAPAGRSYSPGWYSGARGFSGRGLSAFAGGLGGALAASTTAAATPPGSSSGSGGGGSSGGGGGGGGGGG
ncbi:MAG: DUF2207 domain-containing protein, partial [Alphaproteobacteria bacterium]|nr:DUF2207 domain-containing protein [Alphaproteobacteria bacterium]